MSNFDYIENMIRNCEAAKKAQPIRNFKVKNILNLKKNIKDGEFAIYIIREIGGDINETFKKLKEHKEATTKTEKYPKLNSASEILYVGLSSTNLITRLKQHIGKDAKKTYSLKLAAWFTGNYEIEVNIYKGDEAVGQLIEDNLAHNLQPAFGKRGSK